MLATIKRSSLSSHLYCRHGYTQLRTLLTLAIESSCDDSAVAILEKNDSPSAPKFPAAKVHFNEKLTFKSQKYNGIHPVEALEFHQKNLAGLVEKAVTNLPRDEQFANGPQRRFRKPDFITVTRGPGMRSNLSVGLDIAKGLAVAWGVPLVAIHHMQAHALTPRLVSACATEGTSSITPQFPFLTLLVSGGHTMLVHSKSLTDHPILARTIDIAIGDAIDKIGRDVVPPEDISSSDTPMYGPIIEKFAFPNGKPDHIDVELHLEWQGDVSKKTSWGWSFTIPLSRSRKPSSMVYSFTGICSQATRVLMARQGDVSRTERQEVAREALRISFEHLASRVIMALDQMEQSQKDQIRTLVVGGGVAANLFLRTVLRSYLDAYDYRDIELVYPPVELCTDNALMIGWAGMEMFEAGWTSALSCNPLRAWSIDPSADDKGILGPAGWIKNQRIAT